MMQESYIAALEAAKIELAEALVELNQAQQKVQDVGIRISNLRQTVTVLSKLCGEENIQFEDTLGLTDAIRKVFRDGCNRDFTVHDVREQLQAVGFPTAKYGNLLASIHVVVGRLAAKREILQTSKVGSERPSYRWGFKLDPVPESQISWQPLSNEGQKEFSQPYRPGTYVDMTRPENAGGLPGKTKK